MKSFSICCVAASLLLAAPAAESKPKRQSRSAEELINIALGPGYAQWLIGPVALMASESEIEGYLGVVDDAAARAFIAGFWERRPSATGIPGTSLRDLFERRAEDADKRFSQAAYRGRRTDRGAIFIVYGAPRDIRYAPSRRPREPPVEIWLYGPEAAVGLDGRPPQPVYYFIQVDDLVRFAPPSSIPRSPR